MSWGRRHQRRYESDSDSSCESLSSEEDVIYEPRTRHRHDSLRKRDGRTRTAKDKRSGGILSSLFPRLPYSSESRSYSKRRKPKNTCTTYLPRTSHGWGLLLLTILLGLYIADFFSLLGGSQERNQGSERIIRERSSDSSLHNSAHGSDTEMKSTIARTATHSQNDIPSKDVNGEEMKASSEHHSGEHRLSHLNTPSILRSSEQNQEGQNFKRTVEGENDEIDEKKDDLNTRTSDGVESPMNRIMEEIQVPANTGKLSTDQVKEYYRRLVKAYLAPFKNGIYRQLFFEILRRRTYSLTPPGANKGIQSMLIQVIDSKVYLLDPYEVPKNTKAFYRTRINEVIWLLSKLAGEGRIKDTEFLVSIHDCVQTVNKPHTYRGAHFVESSPTFTIVSCNFSDNIPFPMWEGDDERGGGFAGWDRKMEQYSIDITKWDLKTNKAVFRGGNRPSMYFQDKKQADHHCEDVGRTRLQYLGEEHPDIVDISVGGTCAGKHKFLKRLATMDHHKYKYILYAEGNCFWADRINKQLYGPSTIVKQETPCGQFFEPLLRPMTHYIPTDFFFTNTLQQVQWARDHDVEARQIVANANEFATNFLTLASIEAYVEVLLDEYRALLVDPQIKLETGAIEVTSRRV